MLGNVSLWDVVRKCHEVLRAAALLGSPSLVALRESLDVSPSCLNDAINACQAWGHVGRAGRLGYNESRLAAAVCRRRCGPGDGVNLSRNSDMNWVPR